MIIEKDQVLVSNLKAGDIKAYEALYEKYRNRLYHFAFGYLKSHVEAEGLVQDVFVIIWKKRADLKPECSFKSYIFTIGFNQIKGMFSKRTAHRNYMNSKADGESLDYSTMNRVDYTFLMDNLMGVVAKIPLRRRETFMKSRFDGLSVKEIAQEMEVSPKTVENQITLALRFIKSNLAVERSLVGSR